MADHWFTGRYRPDRHGPLPADVGSMPPEPAPWQPSPEELAVFGVAGRRFVDRMLAAFDFPLVEGVLLLEAAHVVDGLVAWRASAATDKQSARLTLAHTKTLAALLAQLKARS